VTSAAQERVESVDEDRVRHVAVLSRLELSEEEVARTARDLTGILHHINKLAELELDGVPPTSHAIPLENILREDTLRPGLERQAALANAPQAEDGCFRVPQII
jgi:aspartyl-tRNA(Asn)/glutamyl-tRNA(Gln) amidotransferase subunit C